LKEKQEECEKLREEKHLLNEFYLEALKKLAYFKDLKFNEKNH